MEQCEIQVPSDDVEWRVDRLLARELGISRRYAVRLIHRGGVRVAGAIAQKGALLRPGETVQVAAFRHPNEGPLPNASLKLSLLAQSVDYLAFDKPAGMPSLPLDFEETASAVNAALGQFPGLAQVGDRNLEAGLVHRLDTDTSGVLVFARNDRALKVARQALRSGEAVKEYRALVRGEPRPGRIELKLVESGKRMRVDSVRGRPATTEILRVDPGGATSLVDLLLITGLRHQIRVSLAHIGHPIVGDSLYGGEAANEPEGSAGRHWLHATRFKLGDFEARSVSPAELSSSG